MLVARMMAIYATDFTAILLYELHDRAFGELTNLPFPYMIHHVPEISGFKKRVLIMVTVRTNTMKDLVRLGLSKRSREYTSVPWVQAKGPIFSIEPNEAHIDGLDFSVDMEIEE